MVEMERSLFVLLPRLPLRLWLVEELDEAWRLWDWYKVEDLGGALADDTDLLLRAAAIFSLN